MDEGMLGRPNSESPGSPVRSGRPIVDEGEKEKWDYEGVER
jgi:hypothetical protein